MDTRTYFLREDYKPNERMLTLDYVSGQNYWSKENLRASRTYQFPVYKYAAALIGTRRLLSVIDVGCGVGTKLSALHHQVPGIEITGIDQPHAIRICEQRYAFGRWYADDFSMPREDIADLRADLVICADVIEHLYDPDILIAYLKKRTAPNGFILLSTPERDRLRGRECTECPNKHHIREWNFRELEAYLQYHELKILEHFVQYPVRFQMDRYFFSEIILRFLKRRPLKYNQVCLLSPSDSNGVVP